MKIRTETNPAGWSAIDDETYDGPGSAIGWGKTEDAAIADLLEQLQDRAETYRDKCAARVKQIDCLICDLNDAIDAEMEQLLSDAHEALPKNYPDLIDMCSFFDLRGQASNALLDTIRCAADEHLRAAENALEAIEDEIGERCEPFSGEAA